MSKQLVMLRVGLLRLLSTHRCLLRAQRASSFSRWRSFKSGVPNILQINGYHSFINRYTQKLQFHTTSLCISLKTISPSKSAVSVFSLPYDLLFSPTTNNRLTLKACTKTYKSHIITANMSIVYIRAEGPKYCIRKPTKLGRTASPRVVPIMNRVVAESSLSENRLKGCLTHF